MFKNIYLLIISFVISGCATNPIRLDEASDAKALVQVEEQSRSLKTVKGRAWIRMESPEGKFSFPADLAIDRTKDYPQMRLEVFGPFGSTVALVIINKDTRGKIRMTWKDYKRQKTYRFFEQWHGLELSLMPDLLLGLSPKNIIDFKIWSDRGAGRYEQNTLEYNLYYNLIFNTINSRWLINTIEGFSKKLRNKDKEPVHYTVQYSGFSESKDFFIPREIELLSNMSILVKLSWRDSQWNESLPAEAFEVEDSE